MAGCNAAFGEGFLAGTAFWAAMLRRWIWFSVLLAVIAGAGAVLWRHQEWFRPGHKRSSVLRVRGESERERVESRWGSYAKARAGIESRRKVMAERWTAATAAEKPAILSETAAALTEAVARDLAPFWYGTRWDFNGTSETPQEGCIACGYFVSTLLRHAGLEVQRVRLAQQASQNIILTLTGAPHLHKGHGLPLPEFVERIRALGPGLSVVGLDNHVGILWHDGAELWFLHSTVAETGDVIKERAAESRTLGNSKYRIAGQITSDPRLLEAWLTARPLPTHVPAPRS